MGDGDGKGVGAKIREFLQHFPVLPPWAVSRFWKQKQNKETKLYLGLWV